MLAILSSYPQTNRNYMSKELDAAKAAFDADLAKIRNGGTRLTEEQVRETIRSVTDPKEQREFMLYMMMASAKFSGRNAIDETDGVNLEAVTEFFESLADEPEGGKNLTRERFEELSTRLTDEDKLYCAKVLIQEQGRRDRLADRNEQGQAPAIRTSAIQAYTRKLSAVLKEHSAPTRAEFEDMMSVLNDEEKQAVMAIQLRMNGGKPLPFRDDGKLH
jgi:hypothetical protein